MQENMTAPHNRGCGDMFFTALGIVVAAVIAIPLAIFTVFNFA